MLAHDLPEPLHTQLSAFCQAHDLDYEKAISEAVDDHTAALGRSFAAIALEDLIDDFIADAVALWLDEQGGKFKVHYYIDFSSPRRHRGEGAPVPVLPPSAPGTRPDEHEHPGGVLRS